VCGAVIAKLQNMSRAPYLAALLLALGGCDHALGGFDANAAGGTACTANAIQNAGKALRWDDEVFANAVQTYPDNAATLSAQSAVIHFVWQTSGGQVEAAGHLPGRGHFDKDRTHSELQLQLCPLLYQLDHDILKFTVVPACFNPPWSEVFGRLLASQKPMKTIALEPLLRGTFPELSEASRAKFLPVVDSEVGERIAVFHYLIGLTDGGPSRQAFAEYFLRRLYARQEVPFPEGERYPYFNNTVLLRLEKSDWIAANDSVLFDVRLPVPNSDYFRHYHGRPLSDPMRAKLREVQRTILSAKGSATFNKLVSQVAALMKADYNDKNSMKPIFHTPATAEDIYLHFMSKLDLLISRGSFVGDWDVWGGEP